MIIFVPLDARGGGGIDHCADGMAFPPACFGLRFRVARAHSSVTVGRWDGCGGGGGGVGGYLGGL